MRLIVEFQLTDDCTYWATETVPLEYESAEKFAVDFETECRENYYKSAEFIFAGRWWSAGHHHGDYDPATQKRPYCSPNIFTVDEWFDHHGVA